MNESLQTTFELLRETRNEAALGVLIPALESPHPAIREAALTTILRRRSPAAHREVLRRLHTLDEGAKGIVREKRSRMTQTIRDALLGDDQQLFVNGCHAAVWLGEYDVVPALINVLEDRTNPNSELASKTVLELTDLLYGQLANPDGGGRGCDPRFVRHHMVGSLELSVERYSSHQRRELVEAFVLLVGRDNVRLKRILENPHHDAFPVLVDVLSKSPTAGAIGLLLSLMDHPHAPSAVLSVVAGRRDLKFVQYLLRKIGREPSTAMRQNLERITSVPWLQDGAALMDQLDDAAQHAVVRLVTTTAIAREQAFATVEHLLRHGKPGGRRSAAEALSEFTGAEANALALEAMDDEDPQVQANALRQFRSRGIPGALQRLVEMVDSRHAVVRKAARESLDEFSFSRFLAAFDMLDDEVRRSTGTLVKKIDPQTVPLLRAEMESRVRTRRLRALVIARTIDLVARLEEEIIKLLHDDDHLVRAEAAAALGLNESTGSRDALHAALEDGSATVQEAAKKSLQQQDQASQRQEAFSAPLD